VLQNAAVISLAPSGRPHLVLGRGRRAPRLDRLQPGAPAILALNTSALPGAAGVHGAITISHDGGYGQLAGKAVALEPATGFTFETALVPRPR
jgi:hypothetical protein